TAKVRVVMPNHDRRLFHKQTGYATVRLEIPDLLLAPRSAVLQHGAEPIVFLQQKDRAYLARRVELGRFGDDTVEVFAGLHEGERVVSQGGLLLDGQAQLARAAVTGDDPSHQHVAAAAPAVVATEAATSGAELKALALAAADAAATLAADDFAAYQKQLPVLRGALHAYLAVDRSSARGALE